MEKSVFFIGNTVFTFYEDVMSYRYDENKNVLPHVHATGELFIVISGSALMCGNFEECRVGNNNVCIMPPRTVHGTVADDNCERLAFPFIFQRTAANADTTDTYSVFAAAFTEKKPLIVPFEEKILSGIFDFNNSDTMIRQEKMRVVFNLILLYVYENLPKDKKSRYDVFPKKSDYYESLAVVDNSLWETMQRNGTLDEFCGDAGLTPRQAARLLSADFGRGWADMRSHFRMRAAEYYIKYYNYSIEEITDMLSYASRESFAVTFKKFYGISPGTMYKEYKKRTADF